MQPSDPTRPLPPVGLLLAVLVLLSVAGCGGRDAPATSSRLDAVRIDDRIRIGVRTDAPPFATRVGDLYVGFDIDIAQAVAAQLGVDDVVLVPLASDDRLDAITSGRVDCVIASLTITRQRERSVDFTRAYYSDGQRLLVAEGSAISSYRDLPGKRVAALDGTTSLVNIRQVAPSAEVVPMADYNSALEALQKGRVDALTSDGLILTGLALKAGGGLQVVGDAFSSEPYGIAVPEDDSDFRDAVDGALQDLWLSGRWHIIHRTWFGPGAPYETPLTFAMTTTP